MKILASNRKAFHDYFIIETWEAGIKLLGTEIKSLRNAQASIGEAWVKVIDGEAWLVGATIPPYENASSTWATHEPTRTRKLLLKRKEITRIGKEIQPGVTVIPLDIHLSDRGYAKVKIALVKGKKLYDKRETIKKRDMQRYGE
jgi:SsrA-binding protein